MTRPMTDEEITAQVDRCLQPGHDLEKHRQGDLEVRYAMVQPPLGPSDSTSRAALLLEDAEGYFDCSGDHPTYTSKGGDSLDVDPSAAGFELPTISGGSTSRCNLPRSTATIDTALVLRTTGRASGARVALTAADGTRTAVVPTRDGFIHVTAQVAGAAAWEPSTLTLELLDADGEQLPVQPYGARAADRLSYAVDPCS